MTNDKTNDAEVDFTNWPQNCASWAENEGCTRIDLNSNQCVRAEDIPTTYHTVFVGAVGYTAVTAIQNCYDTLPRWGLVYGSITITEGQVVGSLFFHVATQSFLWGFVDDIYISAEVYGINETQIRVQSQQRIGTNDSGKNYDHVTDLLSCFQDNLQIAIGTPMPCSI